MSTATSSLVEKLNWRYAVKIFDPNKKLSDEQWNQLKQALILSPSSYGLQPYKFTVLTNPELKEKLVKESWGQGQVKDCSHFVVFTALKKMDAAYVDKYVNITAQANNIEPKALDGLKGMILKDVVNGPRGKIADQWAALQAYIALGNLMTAAAMIDVDACPMEGINPPAYDEILGLKDTPYKTVVACALGFRSDQDKYAKRKKVRFSEADLIDIRS